MAVAETLEALADPHRRRAVEILSRGPVSAGELAAHLQLSPAALTRHLRVLRDTGVVSVSLDRRDTRRHIYSIEPAPLEELAGWSRQLADFWANQLASLSAYIAAEDDAGG